MSPFPIDGGQSASPGPDPVFQIGDRVVYPNSGLCRVRAHEVKRVAGMDYAMLVLQREDDGVTVMVPVPNLAKVGVRRVASREDIALLFEFLVHTNTDPEFDWKVRAKENVGKMVAGNMLDTAEVFKGLHALALIRPLPTREREMYDSARHQLVAEIAAAWQIPLAVAENHLDYALTPPPGSGREAPRDAPIDLKRLQKHPGRKRPAAETDEEGLGLEDDLSEESEEPLSEGDAEASTEESGAGESDSTPRAGTRTPRAGGRKADADEASDESTSTRASTRKPRARSTAGATPTTTETGASAAPAKKSSKRRASSPAVEES